MDLKDQIQSPPKKRSFLQRQFDRYVERAWQKEEARYSKQIELHNNTANLAIKNFEAQVEISELRFQRMILIIVIFALILGIIKLAKSL